MYSKFYRRIGADRFFQREWHWSIYLNRWKPVILINRKLEDGEPSVPARYRRCFPDLQFVCMNIYVVVY